MEELENNPEKATEHINDDQASESKSRERALSGQLSQGNLWKLPHTSVWPNPPHAVLLTIAFEEPAEEHLLPPAAEFLGLVNQSCFTVSYPHSTTTG